jgi:alpha-tubulin suppressor-like RCC1 family protein
MPNQFLSPEGDIENYFVTEYWLIDQYVGDTLWTWGLNNTGHLGDNTITTRSIPVTTFAGGTNWKQVSCGREFIAAIKTDGTLWTWGRNLFGNLGDNTTINRSTPVTTFAGGTNWKQVASGGYHTAAVKTDGTLWTWGRNSYGQLGDNTTTQRNTPVTTFAGGTNWKQVACGNPHIAAIKTDGTLWTWGRNNSGQLGDNTTINRSTPVTTFAGGTNWKQIACGNLYTAAIKTDGTLWTWGLNTSGQLGDNTITNRSTPVTTFAGGTNWKQVAGGGNYIAAIKTDGTLWTWGLNTSGQLGRNSDTALRLTPVTTFAGGTNWADTATGEPEELYTLTGGSAHTAAIKTDGTLWTWGQNTSGQLGDNTIINRSTPVTTFAGGTNWKQVACSNNGSHTAAIKTDGTLWTWGTNSNGPLGDNTTTNRSTPVTTFAGGTNWKQVAGGGSHTAAIKTDGTLWNWGVNTTGQLGDNTTTNRSTPVTTFAGGTNWKQVAGGQNHTAAIKTDGTLWTWGSNSNGQLGDNTIISRSTPVTTFAGGTNWKQIACGNLYTAAIKTDGTLWTWGSNTQGRLGDNTVTQRNTPVTTFAGGTNWKQVACGGIHAAAIKTDGTLWTWGQNTSGQLGDNTIINRSTPVTTFAGGTNWKQVACGNFHTAALNDDGTNKILYLWGLNTSGQLGTNWISQDNQILQTFAGGTNWKQVAGGGNHTAAIKTDGTLWTWGYNFFGNLGDNTTAANRSTPVTTFAGGTNWKQVASGGYHTAAVTSGTDPTYFIS